MSWLRVDDSYDTHPKLLELPEVGRWRWTRALLYCSRQRTNGKLTQAALSEIGLTRYVPKLVEVGLLNEIGGEHFVHDWSFYNGGTIEERVSLYLSMHPEASANEVAKTIPGSRNEVLAAVRSIRKNGNA